MTHTVIVMGSAAATTECFRCNAVASPALRGPARGGPVSPPRQLALSGGKPFFLDVQLAAQAPATSSRPALIAGPEMVLGVMCMGAAAFPTTTRQSGAGNSDSRPLFCGLALASSDDALANGAAAARGRSYEQRPKARPVSSAATETGGGGGGGDGGSGSGGGGSGGGGGGGGGSEEEDSDKEKNRAEALAALAAAGKVLQSLPGDLAQAITSGRVPAEVVRRYVGLEGSPLFRYLMQFGGFKERLLADDLFLTKVAIECGVGLFTKTAAEYEKRRGNFFKELDFVIADVIMALIADFMLVWLPAPTVALRPSLATGASALATFFFNCPDNAFQVAMRGTSYTTLQRLGAIVRNGGKLLAVGTVASLFGTAMTNGLQQLRKVGAPKGTEATAAVADSGESETKVPILATSVAYGVYMAVSSNLRYQVLAGVVEQRFLEPLLEKNKLALSLLSFVARTGNTFLGSLLWVDYARWVGVQTHE